MEPTHKRRRWSFPTSSPACTDLMCGVVRFPTPLDQVKVPEFVAKTWREALSAPDSTPATGGPEERVQLASLTLSNSNRSFSLSLNPELNASSRELCEDGLADLDLVLQQGSSQAADQMLVAVRDQGWPKHGTEKDGGQAGIEESLALQMRYVDGVVQHRLDVDPTSLMKKRKYAKVSRSRFSAAESASRHDEQKQKRKIQVMTDAKIVDIRKPIGADNRKALAKKSGFLEKRVAMESQELLAILFGLFSKQSRWTFGQLQKETLQPTQHLKSVLGQIARLNKVVRGSALAECHCVLSQSNAVNCSRPQSVAVDLVVTSLSYPHSSPPTHLDRDPTRGCGSSQRRARYTNKTCKTCGIKSCVRNH